MTARSASRAPIRYVATGMLAVAVVLAVIAGAMFMRASAPDDECPARQPSLVGPRKTTIQAPLPDPASIGRLADSVVTRRPTPTPEPIPAAPRLPASSVTHEANKTAPSDSAAISLRDSSPFFVPMRTGAAPLSPSPPEVPPITAEDTHEGPRFALPGSVPFTESTSSQEQPTIVMTNDSWQTIGMTFNGPSYRRVSIPPYQTVMVTLPVGEYQLALWGETIQCRYGLGVFRRYKQYETTWVIATRPAWMPFGPLYMGDIE